MHNRLTYKPSLVAPAFRFVVIAAVEGIPANTLTRRDLNVRPVVIARRAGQIIGAPLYASNVLHRSVEDVNGSPLLCCWADYTPPDVLGSPADFTLIGMTLIADNEIIGEAHAESFEHGEFSRELFIASTSSVVQGLASNTALVKPGSLSYKVNEQTVESLEHVLDSEVRAAARHLQHPAIQSRAWTTIKNDDDLRALIKAWTPELLQFRRSDLNQSLIDGIVGTTPYEDSLRAVAERMRTFNSSAMVMDAISIRLELLDDSLTHRLRNLASCAGWASCIVSVGLKGLSGELGTEKPFDMGSDPKATVKALADFRDRTMTEFLALVLDAQRQNLAALGDEGLIVV